MTVLHVRYLQSLKTDFIQTNAYTIHVKLDVIKEVDKIILTMVYAFVALCFCFINLRTT